MKGCTPPKKKLSQTHKRMTLTVIDAKVYNILLFNRNQTKFEKIIRKNQDSFRKNWSITSQILTIHPRSTYKESQGNGIVRRLFHVILEPHRQIV